MEDIIKKIREDAKAYFQDACPSHDWSHVERVYTLATKIAKKENADLFVVQLAALLHDLGRKKEMENPEQFDHAQISVEIARKILAKYHINEQIAEQVLHCISSHRFRKNKSPETLEAKVLYDADKLDCIGAVGIARAYAWAGKQGIRLYSDKNFLGTGYEKEHSPVTEFLFKLNKIEGKIQTQTGKIIAHFRQEYMNEYFKRLEQEIKGAL